MSRMKLNVLLRVASLASGVCSVGQAFMTPPALSQSGPFLPRTNVRIRRPGSETGHRGCVTHRMSASTDTKELGLTPELERLTRLLRSCPNDKMRQMQVLHLAQMGEEKMDPKLMTEQNKVLG